MCCVSAGKLKVCCVLMDFQIIKLMMMIWLIRISKTWDFSCITKVSNRPAIDFNEMRTTVLMNCNKWRQAGLIRVERHKSRSLSGTKGSKDKLRAKSEATLLVTRGITCHQSALQITKTVLHLNTALHVSLYVHMVKHKNTLIFIMMVHTWLLGHSITAQTASFPSS